MTIEVALGWPGIFGKIALVFIGAAWFGLTIFILCVMEVSANLLEPCGQSTEYDVTGVVRIFTCSPSALG